MRQRETAVRQQQMGRRKRKRQKRQARFVAVLLFLWILAVDFGGGFLVGFSWQKSTGKELYPENGAIDVAGNNGTWENMVYDAQWNLILVNDKKPIPEGYEVNLVDTGDGERVDERIYAPLMEMLEDAREANWNLRPRVVSGYRTMEKQQQLYDDKIEEYRKQGYADEEAEELAGQWVAAPEHSEHQLGLAVDINGATYDVYLWLQENSYKYGFIFRYPGNKTEITGVAEEVWHYRYVGVEAATEIREQGICLEEYVENPDGRIVGEQY